MLPRVSVTLARLVVESRQPTATRLTLPAVCAALKPTLVFFVPALGAMLRYWTKAGAAVAEKLPSPSSNVPSAQAIFRRRVFGFMASPSHPPLTFVGSLPIIGPVCACSDTVEQLRNLLRQLPREKADGADPPDEGFTCFRVQRQAPHCRLLRCTAARE